MYYAVLTNKGIARLEGPQDTVAAALRLLHEAKLAGETPENVRGRFATLVGRELDIPSGTELDTFLDSLGQHAFLKVRQPADSTKHHDVEISDPPIEHYRQKHDWGGKREGAGKKARRLDGRRRVRLSVTVDPEVNDAVQKARQEGESMSDGVERLLRQAVAEPART